jgi:hypothetical protein
MLKYSLAHSFLCICAHIRLFFFRICNPAKRLLTSLQLLFNVHVSVHRNNILIRVYIQQDATLHSLFYLETARHVSGGTITNHQERIQLYLQHLVFVTPLLLSVAIVEELEPV